MENNIHYPVVVHVMLMALFAGYYWLVHGEVTTNYIVLCIYLIPALCALLVGRSVALRDKIFPLRWPYVLLAGVLPPLCYYLTWCIHNSPSNLSELLLPPGIVSAAMALIGLIVGAFTRKLRSSDMAK